MKRYNSLWAMLKDSIFGCPIQKQEERLDKAVTRHAESLGDIQFAYMMRKHYTDLAAAIRPDVNWWGYASAKEKEQYYEEMYQQGCERAAELEACVSAERTRLATIRAGD
jgi:hypothetical protein